MEARAEAARARAAAEDLAGALRIESEQRAELAEAIAEGAAEAVREKLSKKFGVENS